jgi:NAD(P)-dependent dehydrogenase (short-subunit alcohol dehydrogenase family)
VKTLAIVGAGPGLGLSLAKTFGQHEYRVALIARNQEKLDSYVQQLQALHIEAAGFAADVMNAPQLEAALAHVKKTLGSVDMLEYSPLASWTEPLFALASALDVTPENVLSQFRMSVLGAITSVKAVLPEMLARGDGILFFTSGLSSIIPLPSLSNVGIATSGLRNYAYTLHETLADRGIYVGTLCIGVRIAKGDPQNDPDLIAARMYEMCEQRDRVEETFPRDLVQALKRSSS